MSQDSSAKFPFEMSGRSDLTERTQELVVQMRKHPEEGLLLKAYDLMKDLRDGREFDQLATVAEEIKRRRPQDALASKFYAQSLIDTGKPSVAIDVISSALHRIKADASERDELYGLKGRAYKQIYIDAEDASSPEAKQAIRKGIEAYYEPFSRNSGNFYHGINLSALVHAARLRGSRVFPTLDSKKLASKVLKSLENPKIKRDSWWSATKAEAFCALGEWTKAERAIKGYVKDKNIPVFNFASTLRQLRDVWEIHKQSPEGLGLIQILEAELASREGSVLEMTPDHIRAMREADYPSEGQRERVLGTANAQTIDWYRAGLDRAASVAAIKIILGARIGTGFAVRAKDFGLSTKEETIVLTNFHVVNRLGASEAEKPSKVEVIFEAGPNPNAIGPFKIKEVLCESPFDKGLDFSLLRLEGDLSSLSDIPVTRDLPDSNSQARIYVIGHPEGKELHFSIQDNHLLDHEGPPNGTPPNPLRRRVHYHTPTSKGNSGSPVFDQAWRCIALHHTGGKYAPKESLFGLKKLNGKSGRYSANEGYWIGSIFESVAKLKNS